MSMVILNMRIDKYADILVQERNILKQTIWNKKWELM